MKKVIKGFLSWIRPSFQDNDGTASYRRLTAFFLVMLDAYIIIAGKITTGLMLNVHYTLLASFLLITGIITTQNVLQFLNKDK